MSGVKMNLAEALARACELLPGRFEVEDSYRAQWFKATYDGKAEYVYTVEFLADGQTCEGWGMVGSRQAHLEYALREEIETRGWHWNVATWTTMGKPYAAAVTLGERYEGEGDTPALALGLALIAALEAQS